MARSCRLPPRRKPGREAAVWALLGALGLLSTSEASQLAWTTPSRSGGVGTPVGTLVVQRRDAASNPIAPAATLDVQLSSTSAAGQFSTAGPEWYHTWSSSTTVTIPAGESDAPAVYYRDGAAGTSWVSATASGFSAASQPVQISALALAADFESGGVMEASDPPGPFNHEVLYGTSNVFTAPASSAHRGTKGLRFVDSNTAGAPGGEGHVALVMAPLSTSELHIRMWVRWQHSASLRSVLSAGLLPGTTKSALEFGVVTSTGVVDLAGNDASLVYRRVVGPAVSVGAWHLVELELTGLGTTAGERAMFIDGEEVLRDGPIDWTGTRVNQALFGIPYARDRAGTGEIEMDDIRVGLERHASRLVVSFDAEASQEAGCVPANVTLETRTGALSPAPTTFDAELSASSGAAWHASAECDSPISSARFSPGDSRAALYVASSNGTHTLSAQYVDFLSRPAALTTTGPSTTGPSLLQPSALTVGCGCAATSSPSFFFLLLPVAVLRARKERG